MGILIGVIFIVIAASFALWVFEHYYKGRAYPGVSVDQIAFDGKTPEEIEEYWLSKNAPFTRATFELRFENKIATLSGQELDLGYDATLSATQAYQVGRSGYIFSDFYQKFIKRSTDLSPYFRWNSQLLDDVLSDLSSHINIPEQDALFQFANGRVVAFRPSRDGRRVDPDAAKKRFQDTIAGISSSEDVYIIPLPVERVPAAITTGQVNSFGIRELIGRGYSEFAHSIPGRVHNVVLATSRINGLLIAPGSTFSFNDAVGDISAATGYQSAYIIKDGKTVLGDGGGVCQVSTTLFRAALSAGLPIVERHAHSYRVQYYEQAGYKPGIDATVFAPSVDLKIKNDTSSYILIQAKPDTSRLSLVFDLYGAKDGRFSQILEHKVWDISAPPPSLYQDDPTLARGVVKQVDWAAWGAKTSFRYLVTKNGQPLQDQTFYSNFRPWQAVYLRGTSN